MKLDLSEIAFHLGKRIKYEIDEPPIKDIDESIKSVEPIKGEVTFNNTGNHIVARGYIKTVIEVDCSRCLVEYRMDLDLPIEEEFRIAGHTPDMLGEQGEELNEEEKEPLFVDNIFDLSEFIRQSIITAVPIKPLCMEACKGLCPYCGQNLNEGECGCSQEPINPKLARLKELLEEIDES